MLHLFGSLSACIVTLLLFGLYWAPTIVAYQRQVNRKVGIILVNAFLGLTILGWFGSLIWASMAETEQQARLREAAYANLAAMQTSAGNLPR